MGNGCLDRRVHIAGSRTSIRYSNLDVVHDSGVLFGVSQPIGNDVI